VREVVVGKEHPPGAAEAAERSSRIVLHPELDPQDGCGGLLELLEGRLAGHHAILDHAVPGEQRIVVKDVSAVRIGAGAPRPPFHPHVTEHGAAERAMPEFLHGCNPLLLFARMRDAAL